MRPDILLISEMIDAAEQARQQQEPGGDIPSSTSRPSQISCAGLRSSGRWILGHHDWHDLEAVDLFEVCGVACIDGKPVGHRGRGDERVVSTCGGFATRSAQ